MNTCLGLGYTGEEIGFFHGVPMNGKTCLITGATAGIGKAAAMQLAQLGATLVLVARDPQKATKTTEQIRQQTGNHEIEFLLADLSSQQQVRQLAEDFKARHQRLDVLVNNAGAVMTSRQHSVDGIEMTFALNYLSYFLLTNLLLDVLTSSNPSRIVNVSSDSHQNAELDFQDLQYQGRYRGFQAYGRSKLANVLFTYELARRLEGTGVTANSLHPGLVATNLVANNGVTGRVMNVFFRVFGRSSDKGARTVTYLASSHIVEGVSGRYYVDEQAVPSSQASYDEEAARQLWQVSEELTGLETTSQENESQDSDDGENLLPGAAQAVEEKLN